MVLEEYSRECPVIEVDRSLDRKWIVGFFERLPKSPCLLQIIMTDNRPEFTWEALAGWVCRTLVKLHLIGKLRDECLRDNQFSCLADARDRRTMEEGLLWRQAAQLSWRPDTTRVGRDQVGTAIDTGVNGGLRSPDPHD